MTDNAIRSLAPAVPSERIRIRLAPNSNEMKIETQGELAMRTDVLARRGAVPSRAHGPFVI